LIAGVVAFTIAGAFVAAHANPSQTQSSAAGVSQTAAQKYKNIRVLKDIPADELIPSMEFISASLGVECDFCHVAGPNHRLEFDKDDKKTKKTARAMMQMMFAINKNNFEGEREVTCNTCHRGSPDPQAIPAILAEGPKPEPAAEHEHAMNPASLPPGLPLLEKYIQALGGTAALQKVETRVETGNALVPDGPPMPITIYTKASDQRVSVMSTPRGESVTAYNGQVGWLTFPGRPVRQMTPEDQLAARFDAEAFYPRKLETQFTDLKLQEKPEKIGDQECDVVLGITKGEPPVKLYFDRSSGLLVRMVHYTNTPLGLLPTQVDFADYRDVDGVKTPYRWTIARPGGSFTIQLNRVEQNVPIDEARFVEPKPAAPIPGAQSSTPSGHGIPEGPKPPQESAPPGAAAPPSGAV
jgi:photosynthetic reaction center cytochrome c subunit